MNVINIIYMQVHPLLAPQKEPCVVMTPKQHKCVKLLGLGISLSFFTAEIRTWDPSFEPQHYRCHQVYLYIKYEDTSLALHVQ